MFEGTIDFGMQWTLPVVEDYEGSKSGRAFEYFLNGGKFIIPSQVFQGFIFQILLLGFAIIKH
jgi:hypothetical protein